MEVQQTLKARWINFIFFGNYFYALCVLALAMESSLQQGVPLNRGVFYLFLLLGTIVYYTFAYMGPIRPALLFKNESLVIHPPTVFHYDNRRTEWYQRNANLLNKTQVLYTFIVGLCTLYLILVRFNHIFSLWWSEWLILLSAPLVALFYYGDRLIPGLNFNLRKTGWLKPFIVGLVWACTVTLYPVMFKKWELDQHYQFTFLTFWLLVKNWMFISVLAIMFDIKDYANDANGQLKTFVVRFGLRRTIFNILLPLTGVGLLAFSYFAYASGFSFLRYTFNLIPFILLLWEAYSLHRRRPILYYLIIIDGLMLVKGLCGIAGSIWFQ